MSVSVPPVAPQYRNPELIEAIRQLKNKPLNASRIPIDPRSLYDKEPGSPVLPATGWIPPSTGIQSVDNAIDKVDSSVSLGLRQAGDTASQMAQGATFGGLGGLGTGALTTWGIYRLCHRWKTSIQNKLQRLADIEIPDAQGFCGWRKTLWPSTKKRFGTFAREYFNKVPTKFKVGGGLIITAFFAVGGGMVGAGLGFLKSVVDPTSTSASNPSTSGESGGVR
jgi:hypothetical protein